jgi:hypothetical protein
MEPRVPVVGPWGVLMVLGFRAQRKHTAWRCAGTLVYMNKYVDKMNYVLSSDIREPLSDVAVGLCRIFSNSETIRMYNSCCINEWRVVSCQPSCDAVLLTANETYPMGA